MSEEKKDKELKKLSREILEAQIVDGQNFVRAAQQQIAGLTQQIQQQIGVIGFAQHFLKEFDIPSIPATKTPLEVK